ncbi:phage tail protein [Hathewaya histolytica]|uniref:phage tail protein n=1 Tax=Hathewaya histolytica TaxID=1498 RepID=UPI003B66D180
MSNAVILVNVNMNIQAAKEAEKEVEGLASKLGKLAKTGLKGLTDGVIAAGGALKKLWDIGVKCNSDMGNHVKTIKDAFNSLASEAFAPLADTLKDTVLPAALGHIDTLSKEFKENGITGLVGAIGEIAAEMLSNISSNLPMIMNIAMDIIQSFIDGIRDNLPQIVSSAIEIIGSLAEGILTMLPEILELGLQLIIELAKGLAESIPTMLPAIIEVVIGICDMIIDNIDTIINVGIKLLLALIQGIMDSLPTLIEHIPRIINSFCDAIFSNLPAILKAGVDILLILMKGIIESIPTLIANLPQIILAIVNVMMLYDWISVGKNLIQFIGNGLASMKAGIGNIASGIAQWVHNAITSIFTGGFSWGGNLISSIGNGFSSMSTFLAESARGVARYALSAITSIFTGGVNIGKNLISGIWTGIKSMQQWILNNISTFAGCVISGIKGFFGIHSPSRVMRDQVGKYLAQGIGVGFEDESSDLENTIEKDLSSLVGKMQMAVDYNVASTTAGIVASRNIPSEVSTVTHNNDNGLNVNIESFVNNRKQDVREFAEELEFYRGKLSVGKGGV